MRNMAFGDEKNRVVTAFRSFVLQGQYVECNRDSTIRCVYGKYFVEELIPIDTVFCLKFCEFSALTGVIKVRGLSRYLF
jgi:hypothetical protein